MKPNGHSSIQNPLNKTRALGQSLQGLFLCKLALQLQLIRLMVPNSINPLMSIFIITLINENIAEN